MMITLDIPGPLAGTLPSAVMGLLTQAVTTSSINNMPVFEMFESAIFTENSKLYDIMQLQHLQNSIISSKSI